MRNQSLDRPVSLQPISVALRTYLLALSLSLGPSLLPLLSSSPSSRPRPQSRLNHLKQLLKSELSPNGFAFAITLSVGGGAALQHFWKKLERASKCEEIDLPPSSEQPSNHTVWDRVSAALTAPSLSPTQKAFFSNFIASYVGISLLQGGRQRRSVVGSTATLASPVSPTLDLTLLLLVRAVDIAVQKLVAVVSDNPGEGDGTSTTRSEGSGVRRGTGKRWKDLTSQIDAFIFWLCSARIMWCFFYEPQRLPRSYVKWIGTLANIDERLAQTLRLIRERKWSYTSGSLTHPQILMDLARELGYPPTWGDPSALPATGLNSRSLWESLAITRRSGVGGIPCEIVHGDVHSSQFAGSCTMNAGSRGVKAFLEAMAIYLPVHFIPIILTRPHTLLHRVRIFSTLLNAVRSATFLSTFVASFWYAVCFTRSLFLARLFPFVSHDFWDGPFGCVFAGCLTCGSSIWIENTRRRGEMALYVLPRAIRTCLPDTWMRSRGKGARTTERIVFALSLSYLLTSSLHGPNFLRGLSRWTLKFIMKRPKGGNLDHTHGPTPIAQLTLDTDSSPSEPTR